MSEIKIAIIGCGSIAHIAHLPSISKTEGLVLEAVCDIDSQRANDTISKWKANKAFSDYKEMFQTTDLDAVVIASPNNWHRNHALAAAKAKVNVIVEKPLAITNFEARDIVDACKKNNVKLMVGCDRRFWTHNQWAKTLVDDGIIVIDVPNDFNPLQKIAQKTLGKNEWWIVPTEHLNYFNFESLSNLLKKNGFAILKKESTFPLELFLLMGYDYLGNNSVGTKIHSDRMNLEKNLLNNIGKSLKNKLYSSFAEIGIGRRAIIYAKKISSKNQP